jgi:hypothetical protein
MRIVTVARKPLSEGNVASNVLKHGCGAINIDGTRLSTTENLNGGAYSEGAPRHDGKENWRYERGKAGEYTPPTGRWPANLVLASEEAAQEMDAQSGVSKSSGGRAYSNSNVMYEGGWEKSKGIAADPGFGDVGGASRYFKQVK